MKMTVITQFTHLVITFGLSLGLEKASLKASLFQPGKIFSLYQNFLYAITFIFLFEKSAPSQVYRKQCKLVGRGIERLNKAIKPM